MRFLIDENIRREIIEFLKQKGHDVAVVPSGIEDDMVAKLAKKEKRILLTHDKHFTNIFSYPPKEFFGIIRIKIHPPRLKEILSSLGELLQRLSYEDLEKRLIILRKDGFQIKR
jgi:predicted nuclease of predicted toxin-antitoxin system